MKDKDRRLRLKLTETFYLLNEKQKRILAASEAKAYGHGGITKVSEYTELCRQTIYRGMKELSEKPSKSQGVRVAGGGRKKKTEKFPDLITEIEKMVEPDTKGDPESPLRWTSKSVRNLSHELKFLGYSVSPPTVASILHELDYSLQASRKTIEGETHPDRNKQFLFINKKVKKFLRRSFPVISVDTKKKELVGNYGNKGREWLPKKSPRKVLVHDFPDPKNPKAVPYGVYDLALNKGWVNVGMSADTAEFAVASIKKWWRHCGKKIYGNSSEILICADSGGSNGYRLHLWKYELQKWSEATGLKIHVCHFPPGTSKWNKIEHRLFSYITKNWRGRTLIDYVTVVNLISSTKTKSGLRVKAYLDKKEYKKGRKVTDDELERLNVTKEKFHGEWNYVINSK